MPVVEEFLEHYNAQDWDALARCFSPTGFHRIGPYGDTIDDSTEYVAFWMDWGSGLEYVGTASVRVHDVTVPAGGLRYAVFLPIAELVVLRFDGIATPTNLCFAGPERDVLVVTAAEGGRVVAFDGVATGAPVLVR